MAHQIGSNQCIAGIDRYATEGEAGLVTPSSRPHTMPTKTSQEVEQREAHPLNPEEGSILG